MRAPHWLHRTHLNTMTTPRATSTSPISLTSTTMINHSQTCQYYLNNSMKATPPSTPRITLPPCTKLTTRPQHNPTALTSTTVATRLSKPPCSYGSTPAGIAAATAAGQLGMNVAVYEPLTMIGGEVHSVPSCTT